MKSLGHYINGQWVHGQSYVPHVYPEKESLYGPMQISVFKQDSSSDLNLLDQAVQGVYETQEQIYSGFFPLYERLEILEKVRLALINQADQLAHLLSTEIAKPISLAHLEVKRSINTLQWTIHAAQHFFNHQGLATQSDKNTYPLNGYYSRLPKGVLVAITPFNFPLNLVLHKIAPAIASGCTVLLKPSPKAMATSHYLADLFHKAGLPAGILNVLQCENTLTQKLIRDKRVSILSFTGSDEVGWNLKKAIPEKTVILELGGTAPVYVHEDANLEEAAQKICAGAFSYAGQVCISVQNVYAHERIYAAFQKILASYVEQFPCGKHSHTKALCSSLISQEHKYNVQAHLANAQKNQMATILARSQHLLEGYTEEENPNFMAPLLLENTPPDNPLFSQEAFAPIANLQKIESLEYFIQIANKYTHRLQCGVFTSSLKSMALATERLLYGGVAINESSALRMDSMPYGGLGQSGTGREGPEFCMQEYTDLKSVLVRP